MMNLNWISWFPIIIGLSFFLFIIIIFIQELFAIADSILSSLLLLLLLFMDRLWLNIFNLSPIDRFVLWINKIHEFNKEIKSGCLADLIMLTSLLQEDT